MRRPASPQTGVIQGFPAEPVERRRRTAPANGDYDFRYSEQARASARRECAPEKLAD